MQSIGNTLVRCTEQIMLLIQNSGKLFYGFVSENEMCELIQIRVDCKCKQKYSNDKKSKEKKITKKSLQRDVVFQPVTSITRKNHM